VSSSMEDGPAVVPDATMVDGTTGTEEQGAAMAVDGELTRGID